MISSVRKAIDRGHPFLGRGLRRVDLAESLRIYADIVIDSATREIGDRVFTYHVPEHLVSEVFIGSQVLVSFGHQDMVPGYVIALSDGLLSGPSGNAAGFATKPILEVLESEPLFDRGYIEFLHWVSEYYVASISEVIAAAVPSDLGPRLKRVVKLASTNGGNGGGDRQGQLLANPNHLSLRQDLLTPEESAIVSRLKESKSQVLAVKALRQRSGLSQGKFYTALSRLRRQGKVVVERESEEAVGPKTIGSVIWTGLAPETAKQKEIVSALHRAGGQLKISVLADNSGASQSTIRKLCQKGVLALVQEEVFRDPLSPLALKAQTPETPPALTGEQEQVLAVLEAALRQKLAMVDSCQSRSIDGSTRAMHGIAPTNAGESTDVPYLLHGVTGSGKTEVYLRLIDIVLAAGRTALLLVPEISLTPQLAERLVRRFGSQVAVWHSGLTAGERFDTWRRLKSGDARVLLGARSAALAAMPDLGLIILDEEHDSSYKQSSPAPRYHARQVAIERGARQKAMVLLGSATPDVASYAAASEAGRVLTLKERVFKQALPASTIVDMRQEYAAGNSTIFSRYLQEALSGCLSRGEQAILLINRRGYASHVFCRACGYVMRCKNCSVSLVYHQLPQGQGILICHHCAYTTQAGSTCPSCQGPFIKQFGLGTQKVEQDTQELFPSARLLRLDSDITKARGAYEEIFNQFASGDADILIGTQIVAKGLDVAKVTLVGVLAADAAFNLPDYRSLERGFQLLTQVSGRAGRGAHAGRVVLQTYNTDMPQLTMAQSQDYNAFAQVELESRRQFEYPPFSQIIRLVLAGVDEALVQTECELLAEDLSRFLEDKVTAEAVKILGPAPCIIERIRGKYRYHLLVKNLGGNEIRQLITTFLRTRRGHAELNFAIDVDAVDLV
jgi:primosomal protein N' (replication factor Y)